MPSVERQSQCWLTLMDFHFQDLGFSSFGSLGSSLIPYFIQILSSYPWQEGWSDLSWDLVHLCQKWIPNLWVTKEHRYQLLCELLTHLFALSFIPRINILIVENIPRFKYGLCHLLAMWPLDMLPKLRISFPHL